LEDSGGGFNVGTAGGMQFVVMTDRRRMRRLPMVIAALSAGGLLVVASCAAPAGEPSRGGPLDPFPPHGMFIADPVGHRFTDGLEILLLQGSQPARIISVRSVGGSQALRHVGTMLAGPERDVDAIQKTPGFPPREPELGVLHRADGSRILPEARTRDRLGYELLLGYEVVSSDVAVRRGIEVTYRVGSTTYERFLPARIIYCPKPNSSRECQKIADDRFPNG
jgi:hypothetical protein